MGTSWLAKVRGFHAGRKGRRSEASLVRPEPAECEQTADWNLLAIIVGGVLSWANEVNDFEENENMTKLAGCTLVKQECCAFKRIGYPLSELEPQVPSIALML